MVFGVQEGEACAHGCCYCQWGAEVGGESVSGGREEGVIRYIKPPPDSKVYLYCWPVIHAVGTVLGIQTRSLRINI